MDFYQTVNRLEETFGKFARTVQSEGAIIYCGDASNTISAAECFEGAKISFGSADGCTIRLKEVSTIGLRTFATFEKSGVTYNLEIPLPGKHNLLNALATISVGTVLGLSIERLAESLSSFPGLQRRLQRYTGTSPLLIFDDYAHNPGKISSCLAGLIAAFPDRRIFAVFQPHRFTRISSLYSEFVSAFRGENIHVVVVPVYSAGEPNLPGFEPDRIAIDIKSNSGVKTFSAPTLKEASDLIKSLVSPDRDIVVTIGAGDVWRIAEDLSREQWH